MAMPNAYSGGYGAWVNRANPEAPAKQEERKKKAAPKKEQKLVIQPWQPPSSVFAPRNLMVEKPEAPQVQLQLQPASSWRVSPSGAATLVRAAERPAQKPLEYNPPKPDSTWRVSPQGAVFVRSQAGDKRRLEAREEVAKEKKLAKRARRMTNEQMNAPTPEFYNIWTNQLMAQRPQQMGPSSEFAMQTNVRPVGKEFRAEYAAAQTKRKKDENDKVGKDRALTAKEYYALPATQRNAIRFNTEYDDAVRAKDKKALDALFNAVQPQGMSRRDFDRGRATLTNEDIWGTAGTGGTGFDTKRAITWAQRGVGSPQQRAMLSALPIPISDRDMAVRRISEGIDKYFKNKDTAAQQAAKLDASLGQQNSLLSTTKFGADAPPPLDPAKYGLTPQEAETAAAIFELTAKPSVWKQKGASYNAVLDQLKAVNIPIEKFAQFSGDLALQRDSLNVPLSGQKGDSFDMKAWLKQLGFEAR